MDTIILSKELESKFSLLLKEPIKQQTLNDLFPTPETIEQASAIATRLKEELSNTQSKIYALIQQQNNTKNPILFKRITEDIQGLLQQVKLIEQRAGEAERHVIEITRDIKLLDQSKRNLTSSITLLKQVHITVNGLECLKGLINRKQYRQISELLSVLVEIAKPLRAYPNVQQLKALIDRQTQLEQSLKKQIFSEFESAFQGGTFTLQKELLHDACLVLDLLPEGKNSLCRWYIELMLQDYRNIFNKNPEVAGLADIARRFSWFKRMLKQYDEQHSLLFPLEWKMDELVTVQYCQETKRDLAQIMVQSERDNTFDTNVMLQAIHTTIDFETKLNSRFCPSVETTPTEPKFNTPKKFDKILSSCFDSFLWHYVDSQDQILNIKFQEYKQTLGELDEGIYQTSFDLFLFYRQTMANCAQLSTGKAFFDLCKMYQKWLVTYDQVLQAWLKEEKRVPTKEELVHVCAIINTADYCSTTTTQLEEKMIETTSEEFKTLVGFQSEVEGFVNTTVYGLNCLVKWIEYSLDPALTQMSKKQWGQVASVGDQSDYITTIGQTLSQHIPVIKQTLTNTKFFRSFCDKFVESFLSKFLNTIYKCKPISEVGAEQMLLDTHSLNQILVEMTRLGDKGPPPTTFTKILQRGVLKVDQLLKVVLRPHDPPEGIVETYLIVFTEHSLPGFQKILELKGLRRSEMNAVMEVYSLRAPKNGTGAETPQGLKTFKSFMNKLAS